MIPVNVSVNEELFIRWAEINHGDHDGDTHDAHCDVYDVLRKYKAETATLEDVYNAVVETEGDDYLESWSQFLEDHEK